MPGIDELYNWLARDVSPAANQLFAAALPRAEPEWADRIGRILVERRHETAWVALAANYLRFNAAIQERIRKQADLARKGLAAALTLTDSAARRSALGLLCEMPDGELAPSAAACLRDPDPFTRDLAAKAVCLLAERALAETPQDARHLVTALTTALRTFERHRQPSVLRACLWYARELGEPLWTALGSGPGRCGHVVEQHLPEWNEPRLAAFLILGMARPAWQRIAEQCLSRWDTHEHALALLAQSDLLSDMAVRRAMPRLKRPRFFVAALGRLAEIAPELRACVPHWICVLGFSEHERLRCLELCAGSQWPELQRAAAHAMTSLSDSVALRGLAEVASKAGAAQQFARWYVLGRRVLAGSGGARRTTTATSSAARSESP